MDILAGPSSLPTAAPRLTGAPVNRRDTSTALQVRWARDADDVQAAQRLRHAVFALEMGAQLDVPPGTPAGLDVDRFDAFCEHLIVCTAETDSRPGEVVGTYRVLTPDGARRAGGLYTETEFDLAPIRSLLPRAAELGRSCVAPAWRQGGVILMLWSSLADFMVDQGLDAMLGCASVSMRDGGQAAAALWRQLRAQHLAAPEQRVRPHLPLPVDALDDGQEVAIPPLIRGYLRCGATVLGAPAWDPSFDVADFPLFVDRQRLPALYRRRAASA